MSPLCPSEWEFSPDCCSLPDDVDQAIIDRAVTLSTNILWRASGMRYGPCEVTVRPCLMSCDGAGAMFPYRGSDGQWHNFCGCAGDCSCDSLCEIVLDGPVAGIEEVTIGTETLDSSQYRLDKVGEGWRLLRTDGGCWPDCQTMTAECGEEGAFCVTYLQGTELDALALAAHSELVCEIAKACSTSCRDCRIPKNVGTLVRQGVSITFDTTLPWIYSLPTTGLWLQSVNPKRLAQASTVFSPDIPQTRQTVVPSS